MEKRKDALPFAWAMRDLEGLPAKEEIEQNLQLWISGERKFVDFCVKSLRSYHVLEVMQ